MLTQAVSIFYIYTLTLLPFNGYAELTEFCVS